ncbi:MULTISPECIES: ATP-binding protein [Butyricimonas]|uniref:ATP-binding protein n=1 Tax=Butyricimonas TaxID=574697 RepID=UPI0007FB45D2|nr:MULTISPECIES: ATP-binding protein [Butyricimonas]
MQTLSDHILDIAQNSIRAKASRVEIDLQEDPSTDSLTFTIRDNGCGMDEATLAKVTDPFFTSRTVRKVGLGIPLLKQNAEATGGTLQIESKQGVGTTLEAKFSLTHWDRPPLGDVAGSIVILVSANPDIEFIYRHITEKGCYTFDTEEVKEIMEGVPVNDPEIVMALRQMIRENIKEITQTT